MAVERNPFKETTSEQGNIIPIGGITVSETEGPTFEIDDDGGVTVNFEESEETIMD